MNIPTDNLKFEEMNVQQKSLYLMRKHLAEISDEEFLKDFRKAKDFGGITIDEFLNQWIDIKDKDNNKCYFCNDGYLIEKSSIETRQYKNVNYDVEVEYSECCSCGEEVITTDQIRRNEYRVKQAKQNINSKINSKEA